MTEFPYSSALIVGAGPGLSASLARQLTARGVKVALAARNIDKLNELAGETGARTFATDAAQPASVAALFDDAAAAIGDPEVVVYNASGRLRGPLTELDPVAVEQAIAISAYGGFLVSQQAAKRMIPHGHGAILFTGATASIKGYAQSAAFAMGKFALRGLAQSAARELGPKGIHVAHFIIDGAIRSRMRQEDPAKPDATLDPDAIAQSYIDVLLQHRSAWSQEIELRPWTESF
ncbi:MULTISPECIES: SDR family NAD(P)-dependent oxidoreductase [unclassified Rhizobium]|uniref:SDR family NAD(P)-dependent oxidoreductase n=1 Tax=unclassified Rhizobium TaxID=2613769 RepID=UPI00105001C0|nr:MULTISPECIES: SDR family NAD(P)-dependent oxidoreductase [unclassified Rhizobium]MBB3393845.1 NAD(P)-dependent dehydrogenase (short-subunit alcohol dehydrogenase family) [Rhizobium sp. BK060]MBB4169174.1 NAD(P)-dependent dehydrogenase (short-subunit alcohol dehydrogenase family) [Rhizobium sp. BK538]TCM71945.1 NADP-dependent 3-hydroxy acid dehydrogenase YdfG [Rhizobium sp. BK068]